MIRSSSAVLLGMGGEAVGTEGIGHRVEGGAERALHVADVAHCRGHRAAVLDADLFGHGLGLVRRQHGEGPAEQGDEDVVVADREVELHGLAVGAVPLRRAAGTGGARAAADGDLQVPAGGQLVQVVAGHVGVEVEPLGDLARRQALGVLVGEEVDLAPGRIAERRGDRRDRRGELGWTEGLAGHLSILPTAIGEIPWPPWNRLRPEDPAVPTEAEIIEALRPVEDPELHRSIVDLGMVKEVAQADSSVRVMIALTTPGCPLKNEINTRVRSAVQALDGVEAVQVDFTAMTPDELASLRQELHGTRPPRPARSPPTATPRAGPFRSPRPAPRRGSC